MGETGGGGQTGAEAFHLEGPEFRKAFVNLQVPAITCHLSSLILKRGVKARISELYLPVRAAGYSSRGRKSLFNYSF